METYEVAIWLGPNSQPIVYDALTTYEKGSFFCIAYFDRYDTKRVRKFPVSAIWAVDEEYKYIGWMPTAQEKL